MMFRRLFNKDNVPIENWSEVKEKISLLELEYNIRIARTLGNAASLRDHETEAHNLRVAYMSALLGEKLGFSKKQLQSLMKGAFLHDIGKIGISDKVLLKNGKLDEEEWREMKLHPLLGRNLVIDMPWFDDAIDVILYHHEKFDGSGYPEGLKGENIPMNARIFAVIDVFDALVSKRPYKESMEIEEALEIIRLGKGKHFQPEIVDLFCKNIRDVYDEIYISPIDNVQQLLIEKRKNIFGV